MYPLHIDNHLLLTWKFLASTATSLMFGFAFRNNVQWQELSYWKHYQSMTATASTDTLSVNVVYWLRNKRYISTIIVTFSTTSMLDPNGICLRISVPTVRTLTTFNQKPHTLFHSCYILITKLLDKISNV